MTNCGPSTNQHVCVPTFLVYMSHYENKLVLYQKSAQVTLIWFDTVYDIVRKPKFKQDTVSNARVARVHHRDYKIGLT